ncbi:MAG: MFS transporter, partial [Nitrospinota bacterium]|nr:MFS transporter [Nitrospinota bacterium]
MGTGGESRSFFFGWFVVAASCLVFMFTFGAAVSFGVYLKPLAGEFGWSRGTVSLAYSIFMLTTGLASAISGKLHDSIGVRPVLFLAVVGGGLGLILVSRTSSLWHLYFSFGILAGGLGAGFSNVPVVATVGLWFDRRRGIATALSMSGASIGILLLPPVIRTLIDSVGWRGAFLIQGIVTLVLLLAAAMIIRAPREGEAEPPSREGGEKRRFDIPALPRPSTMWTIRCATIFCCICHSIP